MSILRLRLAACVLSVAALSPAQTTSHLADPFAPGWMLIDTNGDGIADTIAGKIVVPARPNAAENAAAANLAARLGNGTTGLTPPTVITATEDRASGPRIWIGRNAVPARYATSLPELSAEEGGIFLLEGNLAVIGKDDAGLLAAANALAARAPYIWKVPGDRLTAIPGAVTNAQLTGLTYLKGKAGINRAFLASQAAVPTTFPKLTNIQELVVNGTSLLSATALAAILPTPPPPAPIADPAPPAPLDLATLYTMRGLFRGTPRMPIPSALDSQIYVPAGAPGVAMANLAARMGMESTGLTLPFAYPGTALVPNEVRTKTVLLDAQTMPPGAGQLRIVEKAFGRQSAVQVRGDEAGAATALALLSDHLPNLWEPGKRNLSLEEIRFDLHRFFSLRSAPGQASVALYRLENWMRELKTSGPIHDLAAKVYVDIADPNLPTLIQKIVGPNAKITTGSLHAGTQCCEKTPTLHYQEPGYTFQQSKPAFAEDIVIPWEGTRLIQAVNDALPKLKPGAPAHLTARVSEGPEQRRKLQTQLTRMLTKAGAKAPQVNILCSFKSGYSWLMDEVAPQLQGQPVAALKIEFKKNTDPTHLRAMFSPARWVQELYPVDEDLARTLKIPLAKIEFAMYEGPATYRVHAYNAANQDLLTREFTVATVMQPYNGIMKSYEQVEVATGWVRLESGPTAILDQRIRTDIEVFWDHYQNQTLPRIYTAILSQSNGEIRPEYAPVFDTLRIDIHMSEPDYELGIDKERISSLEALQEDTFYSTENFVNMIGELQAGRPLVHIGRIIPIVHAPEDGKDGHVRIEFYPKPAANPQVELTWVDASGQRQERKRDLPVLAGAMQPRLVQANVQTGQPGPQSITWSLPADFATDDFEEWAKLEGHNQIEHSIFPAAQAQGQLRWLQTMQATGMYKNDLRYPYLRAMNFEFELPRPLTALVDSAAPRELATLSILPPAFPRPMITDYANQLSPRKNIVQWDEPIPPSENAAVLAKLSTYPGIDAYWMGRSYLGTDLWAADVTLPTPSTLRSQAKETTLKATVVYSGRQHANEVSSTSHILKLGEQLATDPETRALLQQVNVVLHPITNADGADLSVQLAEITPNNMLHPGYHGALAADVAVGQRDMDPLYPESRTRKLLQDTWLPDTFLNPHGYPSHEWVQPFSEYSGWVQSRQGANPGRGWWIPRGWFTSLSFSRDPNQPYSEKIANEIKDRIADAQNTVPGLMDLEARMNARYQRFGQRWQPRDMQQPLTKGVRIYMSLKGGGNRGGGGVEGPPADITWNSGYTEAPDETAHGDYMKLMASAGLAFDRVHLKYLAEGKLRIERTQREQGGKVTFTLQRLRPNLPAGEPEPQRSPNVE